MLYKVSHWVRLLHVKNYADLGRNTPFAAHYEKIRIHLCETNSDQQRDQQREDTFISAKKRTFAPKSDSITIFAF